MIKVEFSGDSYVEILEHMMDFIENTYEDNTSETGGDTGSETGGDVDPEFPYAWVNEVYHDIVPLYGDAIYGSKFAVWEVIKPEGAYVFSSVGLNNKGGHMFEKSELLMPFGTTFYGFRKLLEAGTQANGAPHVQTLDPDECAVVRAELELVGVIEEDGSITLA